MKSQQYDAPFWKKAFDDFVDSIGVVIHDWDWQKPAANLWETPDAFEVELAVPGYQKKDFSIQIKGDHLEISADKEEDSDEGRKLLRRGFQFKHFKRSIRVSDRVDRSAVKARYDQGILTIILPKMEKQKDKPGFEVPVQ